MKRDIDLASLMKKHFEVEFVFDDNRRILRANDWTEAKTAKFLLGITRSGISWAFGVDLPQSICAELGRIAKLEDFDPSVSPNYHDRYLEILTSDGLKQTTEIYDSFTYWYPNRGIQKMARDCVLVSQTNQDLLSTHFEHMLGYEGKVIQFDRPVVAQLIGGVAVAVCSSARSNREAHECYVLVVPEYRNSGLATNVVSSWANAVSQMGILPLYNTSIENVAAQNVAVKSGFSLYGRALRIH